MAAGSTIHNFQLILSDIEREVYETFTLQVARHDSELLESTVLKALAYSLEFEERLELTRGLDDPEVPALWSHDLTGKLTRWIEVGSPSAAKLHKACKKVSRVTIYPYRDPEILRQQLKADKIYKSELIEIVSFEPDFLLNLVSFTEKRNRWELAISERILYLGNGTNSLSTSIIRHSLTTP